MVEKLEQTGRETRNEIASEKRFMNDLCKNSVHCETVFHKKK